MANQTAEAYAEYLEQGGDFAPTLNEIAAELRRLAAVEAQRDDLLEGMYDILAAHANDNVRPKAFYIASEAVRNIEE